jgi:uncharacterized protein
VKIAKFALALGLCFLIGSILFSGSGGAKALFQAAKNGDVLAQYNLGRAYFYGEGFRKDPEWSAFWFQLAAEQGDPWAQTNLAYLLDRGLGVKRNPEAALHWIRKAAVQGDPSAQHNLGVRYLYGQGVSPLRKTALFWLEKSANQGYVAAQSLLGKLYSKTSDGNFVVSGSKRRGSQPRLPLRLANQRGFEWTRKAAQNGDPQAQFYLGKSYLYGKSVSQDYGKALHWLQKAGNQENQEAQFLLGEIYLYSTGVETNLETAHQWFSRAAQGGMQKAREAKKLVESRLSVRD